MFGVFRNLFGRSRRVDVHSVESELTLVALVLDELDRALLSHLAAKNGWTIHFARTRGEAWEVLNESKAQIILCEREGSGKDWRDVIRMMVSAPHLVCAILISRATDNYLWNEVTMWGGHDVLATPLREENVVRAIRLAWLYWSSASRNEALSHSV
jgi:DNA-binding response OmpR family regulator